MRQGIDSLAYWTLTNKVKEEQKILGIRVDERQKHIDNREKISHLKQIQFRGKKGKVHVY